VDPDSIEYRNQRRSALLKIGEIGEKKSDAVARILARSYPETSFVSLPVAVGDLGWQHLTKSDVIICATDSEGSRAETSFCCNCLKKAWIDCAVSSMKPVRIRISYFRAESTSACFACLLGDTHLAEALMRTSAVSEPCWASPTKTDSFQPSLGLTAAGIAMEYAIEWLDKPPTNSFGIEFSLGQAPAAHVAQYHQNKSCPLHPDLVGALILGPPEGSTDVDSWLGTVCRTPAVLVLPWPLCVLARCECCGFSSTPLARVGVFRQSGKCSRCQAKASILETITTIESGTSWSLRTFSELNLPDNHIYEVRSNGGLCSQFIAHS